jgi:hypothetical protein
VDDVLDVFPSLVAFSEHIADAFPKIRSMPSLDDKTLLVMDALHAAKKISYVHAQGAASNIFLAG